MLFRFYQFLTFCFISFITVSLFSVVAFLLIIFSYNVQTIQYGFDSREITSLFKVTGEKAYVLVPSGGYYEVQADIETLKKLSDHRAQQHVGIDKNHVYCGVNHLAGLNPQKVRFVGNEYLTDGSIHYFCGKSSEPTDISLAKELWQRLLFALKKGQQLQVYYYPFHQLIGVQGELLNKADWIALAADNQTVYFKGLVLEDANPRYIRAIKTQNNRDSFHYFTDEQHIYYHNQQLPIRYHSKIVEIKTDRQNQPAYLYSEQTGEVVAEDVVFPKENQPYRPFSFNTAHRNHDIWIGKDEQLYIYDHWEKKVKLISKNPLSADAKEIANGIFIDKGNTYFLQDSEYISKGSSRSGGGITSRTYYTHLQRAENLSVNWQNIAKYNRYSIWENNGNYYYFDNLGDTQGISYAIYQIVDKQSVQVLSKENQKVSDIRKLIKQEKLIPFIQSQNILEIKTKWRANWWLHDIGYYILGLIIFVKLFHIVFKRLFAKSIVKQLRKPFYIQNDELLFCKIFPKRYRLQRIKKVTLVLTKGRRNLAKQVIVAELNLFLKDKPLPIEYKFAPISQNEQIAYDYLFELKQELENHQAIVELQTQL